MIAALALLFVLSGAAGLFYEAVWSRYLSLFVGHDAYAQILTLVIFLGGMGLGAFLVSRRSARMRDPLAVRTQLAAGRPDRARAAYDLLRPYSTRSEGDIRLALLNSYLDGAGSPAP